MQIRKNLIFGAKVALGTLTAATVAAGVGYALQTGGSKLQAQIGQETGAVTSAFKALGEMAQHSGDILFSGGRFVGYSVLLPLHTFGYLVPKWLKENGIPSGITFERLQTFVNVQELSQFVQGFAGSVFAEFDKHAINCKEFLIGCHAKAVEQCGSSVQAGLVNTSVFSPNNYDLCVIGLTLKNIFKKL